MKSKSKFDPTKLTLEELRAANSEYLRRTRTTKPKSTKPCVQCGRELGARERRLPCPDCGARNWDVTIDGLTRSFAGLQKKAIVDRMQAGKAAAKARREAEKQTQAAHAADKVLRKFSIVPAKRDTVVLVACCGPKLDGTHAAQDIYTSDLFVKARAYAEQHGTRWAILSALHGLVMPEQRIAAYDVTLNTMTKSERSAWGSKVREQLLRQHWSPGTKLVVLAGENYCTFNDGRFDVERPMKGLGIGQQKQWLKNNTKGEN